MGVLVISNAHYDFFLNIKIDAVWNRVENLKFQENKGHILGLMEHLNIIARPVLYTDDDGESLDHV